MYISFDRFQQSLFMLFNGIAWWHSCNLVLFEQFDSLCCCAHTHTHTHSKTLKLVLHLLDFQWYGKRQMNDRQMNRKKANSIFFLLDYFAFDAPIKFALMIKFILVHKQKKVLFWKGFSCMMIAYSITQCMIWVAIILSFNRFCLHLCNTFNISPEWISLEALPNAQLNWYWAWKLNSELSDLYRALCESAARQEIAQIESDTCCKFTIHSNCWKVFSFMWNSLYSKLFNGIM